MNLFYGVHKETYWRKVLRKFQFPKKYLWSPVIFTTSSNPVSFSLMLANTILFSETL